MIYDGLGILDLQLAGLALHLWWLWWQRCDHSRAWANLPMHHDKEVITRFDASTKFEIGNGESMIFWIDAWIGGRSIRSLALNLFACVPPSARSRTVKNALED